MSVCDYYRRMSNDASEAWTLLFRLFVSQRGRVPQVAAEFDLSPMQAHVLRLLEPDQPLPMRTLARKLCCDASNVTGIVDRLEERGLVRRDAAPGDRRVKMLVVTSNGLEVRRRIVRRPSGAPQPPRGASPERAAPVGAPGADRTAVRHRSASAARDPEPGVRAGPVTEAAKPTQTRRILRLFYPYRLRLSGLLGMILISAGISLISPFLLRDLLDNVLSQGSHLDTRTLTLLVGGMVAIPIVTGVIGVAQTWQSNLIGQQVMHDLRASVYTHLQRLSLAFFTRTRTGEVQSRIANDIGGVQTVVTTTATSIVSNVTTVLATTVAMAVLDWRLTLASFAILPLFVWMTRRVGRVRKALAATMQGSLADISTLVEESLSVSGVLLAKTMGQTGDLTDRFTDESRRLADLELRQRMAGRWMMATVQSTFAIMPALMYGIAGFGMARGGSVVSIGTLVAFTTLQTRLLFPIGSLLNVQADLQTSTALFDRVFEYLDLPVEIEEPADPVPFDPARAAGEVEFRNVGFHYDEAGGPTLRDINFVAPAGSRVAIVGETGAGKTTLGYLTARLYDVTEGAVLIDGVDVRDLCFDALRGTVGVVSQETYLFHGTVRENRRFPKPEAADDEF